MISESKDTLASLPATQEHQSVGHLRALPDPPRLGARGQHRSISAGMRSLGSPLVAGGSRQLVSPAAQPFLALECLVVGPVTVLLAMVAPSMPCNALLLASTSALTVALARVSMGRVLRRQLPPLGFIALSSAGIAFGVDFTNSGVALVCSPARTHEALRVALRALSATSGLLMISFAAPPTVLLSAAARLPVPPIVVELAGLSWRWLWLTRDTFTRMLRAQEARLGSRSVRARIRGYGSILAVLVVRSLARARRMDAGLAARGYDGALRVMEPPNLFAPWRVVTALSLQLVSVGLGLWIPWRTQ